MVFGEVLASAGVTGDKTVPLGGRIQSTKRSQDGRFNIPLRHHHQSAAPTHPPAPLSPESKDRVSGGIAIGTSSTGTSGSVVATDASGAVSDSDGDSVTSANSLQQKHMRQIAGKRNAMAVSVPTFKVAHATPSDSTASSSSNRRPSATPPYQTPNAAAAAGGGGASDGARGGSSGHSGGSTAPRTPEQLRRGDGSRGSNSRGSESGGLSGDDGKSSSRHSSRGSRGHQQQQQQHQQHQQQSMPQPLGGVGGLDAANFLSSAVTILNGGEGVAMSMEAYRRLSAASSTATETEKVFLLQCFI